MHVPGCRKFRYTCGKFVITLFTNIKKYYYSNCSTQLKENKSQELIWHLQQSWNLKLDLVLELLTLLFAQKHWTCQSTGNLPPPKEIRSGLGVSIMYLKLVLILPIKVHPDLPTLNIFQDFDSPSLPDPIWINQWSILDMGSFYISSFIKIWSPICKINMHQFSQFPFPPALPPPKIVELGKQICHQVNLCRSQICIQIFIILACPEAPNMLKHWNPPPLKRVDTGCYFNHVSMTHAYSSHQASSQSLHSKHFPRFPIYPFHPHNVTRTNQDLN